MIRHSYFHTTTEAYFGLFDGMLNHPDWIDAGLTGPNYRHWSRDHIVEIENPRSELNLGLVGFSTGRWKKFLGEYFEEKSFRNFLVFLKERRLNDAQEYAYQCSTNARHSLGNCLFGVSVRTGHYPRVTLVSRSCNLVPTGVLDLSLASCLAEYVANICGTEYCKVVWVINHLQMNSWPATVFLLNIGIDPTSLPTKYPFARSMIYAYESTLKGENPNRKYMFYERYMKKIEAASKRWRAGELIPPNIPHLPPNYLPYWEEYYQSPEPEVDEPSLYSPEGGELTEIELDENVTFRKPLQYYMEHEIEESLEIAS